MGKSRWKIQEILFLGVNMAIIAIKIDRCDQGCPHCKQYRTLGVGCADDYHCEIVDEPPYEGEVPYHKRMDVGRLIMSYIEWDSEKIMIPAWCPLRVKATIK